MYGNNTNNSKLITESNNKNPNQVETIGNTEDIKR